MSGCDEWYSPWRIPFTQGRLVVTPADELADIGKHTKKGTYSLPQRIHRESPGKGRVSQSDCARLYVLTFTEQVRYVKITCRQERIFEKLLVLPQSEKSSTSPGGCVALVKHYPIPSEWATGISARLCHRKWHLRNRCSDGSVALGRYFSRGLDQVLNK